MLSVADYSQLCFQGAALGLAGLAYALQRLHLRDCPKIHTDEHLRLFACMVRQQMYLCLCYLLCLVSAIVLTLLAPGSHSLGRFLLLSSPYLLVLGLGWLVKRTERFARDVTRCDERHATAFARICRSWSARLLPDF